MSSGEKLLFDLNEHPTEADEIDNINYNHPQNVIVSNTSGDYDREEG